MFFNTSLFTTTIVFFLTLFGAFVTAAPVVNRDVYVPPVIYPCNGTVWKAGSTHNVTWYAISCALKRSQLITAKGCVQPSSRDHEQGGPDRALKAWSLVAWYAQQMIPLFLILTFNALDTPLAMGFDIRLGHQEVTLPAEIEPGTDYAIVRELKVLTSGHALF